MISYLENNRSHSQAIWINIRLKWYAGETLAAGSRKQGCLGDKMKITKNLPIYLLSASLLFVGVTSISQAQGATSTSSQILALQKQINTLKSEAQNTHDFINIIGQKFDDRITALENKPGSLSMPKTVNLTYITSGQIALCPIGVSDGGELNLLTLYNTYHQFRVCTVKVLIP